MSSRAILTLPDNGGFSGDCRVVRPGSIWPVLPFKGDVSSVLPRFTSPGQFLPDRSSPPNRCLTPSISLELEGFIVADGEFVPAADLILEEVASDLSFSPSISFSVSILSPVLLSSILESCPRSCERRRSSDDPELSAPPEGRVNVLPPGAGLMTVSLVASPERVFWLV